MSPVPEASWLKLVYKDEMSAYCVHGSVGGERQMDRQERLAEPQGCLACGKHACAPSFLSRDRSSPDSSSYQSLSLLLSLSSADTVELFLSRTPQISTLSWIVTRSTTTLSLVPDSLVSPRRGTWETFNLIYLSARQKGILYTLRCLDKCRRPDI